MCGLIFSWVLHRQSVEGQSCLTMRWRMKHASDICPGIEPGTRGWHSGIAPAKNAWKVIGCAEWQGKRMMRLLHTCLLAVYQSGRV